jgi:peptidoglycan/xylan/chitin deacetylase (PgdA/CDA1 family)
MPIPILMYHVVSAARPGTPNPQLWVPQATFAQEMRALARAGYRGITLRQAFDAWNGRGTLPRRPVVVSFDDGYLSQYTHARPVLQRLGWPGVLDLEVRNIGPGGLTKRQVKGLLAGGWELASHTITHPDLTTVSDARLRHELVDSRSELRARFQVPIDFFCYPSGRYDARVIAAVKAAGYEGATTIEEGYATPDRPYVLKRVRVNGTDTAADLLAKLRREKPAA